MKKTFLFAAIALASFAACKKTEHTTPQNPRDVGGPGIAPGGCVQVPIDCNDVICTMQFAEVMLTVKDGLGNPVALDSFVVTDFNGTPLPLAPGGFPVYSVHNAADGLYTLINDGWVTGHQGFTMSVRAKGFISNALVFDKPFTISADCCHASKASGNEAIVIP